MTQLMSLRGFTPTYDMTLARKNWADAGCQGDGFSLQISDRAYLVGPEQLEAADVETREDDDAISGVYAHR